MPETATSVRSDLRKLLSIVIVGVLFIAFIRPVSNFVGNFMAERLKESLPDEFGPPTTPDSTTTTTIVLVDAPPTFNIECPVPAQGWVATMAATQYVEDPVGYHTWYRVGGDGLWLYTGLFRSGLDGPPALKGIASGVQVELRYDREALDDPLTSEGYATFVTDDGC